MWVLGLDTATGVASTGLVRDGVPYGEESRDLRGRHTEVVLQLVASVLERAELRPSDIDGLAVSIGPGAFSGLRIGLSTAKGLAYATGAKIAGVPTLEALARSVIDDWRGLVCPVLDARRREVYGAVFRRLAHGRLARLTPDSVLGAEQLAALVGEPCWYLGDGAEAYRAELTRDSLPGTRILPFDAYHPRGSVVALLGWERFKAGKADDLTALVPRYIRRSDAERKRLEGG